MGKPFDRGEVAPMRAFLRRRDARRLGLRRVGEIFIDTAAREVGVGERPVRLAGKQFARGRGRFGPLPVVRRPR